MKLRSVNECGDTGVLMTCFSHRMMPVAFDIFQFWLGCTVAKRNLVMRHYSNQKRVLEVGCATGNIAVAFLNHDVDYTGLDIDGAAIDYATRKFRGKRGFAFVCSELQNHSFQGDFDFIVFSGVLHHVDDATALGMLEFSCSILSPEGVLLISDPIEPGTNDSYIVKLYRKHLERGKYMRDLDALSRLLAKVRGLRVVHHQCHGLGPFPICSRPTVSNFAVFCLKPVIPRPI